MRRIRRFFLIMTFAILSGCTTHYQPVRVEVPVEVKCRPPAIAVPAFPLKTIPINAPIDTKTKAALAELYLRRIYEDQLTSSIQACGG